MNSKGKKSKVLFIMHYPPPIHGAAMVGQYIKESTIINSDFNCSYINLSTSRTVDEIGKTGLIKWLRYASIIQKTISSLITFKPKLVYITLTSTGTGFYKDAMLLLLAKLWGKRILIHFHNKGVRTRQHKTFDNLLYKFVFKGSKVILLAPQLYHDIEKYVPKNNVYYCSNGIPEISYKAKPKQSSKKLQLLFLSNLIAAKGVFTLLEACSLLTLKGVEFTCTYIGGEGDVTTKELEAKIKELNLADVVVYEGKKYASEKYKAYATSDIFVLPTFYTNECFPLVLLEAMQFSLPLVASNEGGIPDIIDEGINGFMIKSKNSNALANKLEVLLTDTSLRKSMGKKANEKYTNKYTLALFEKKFLKIVRKETL